MLVQLPRDLLRQVDSFLRFDEAVNLYGTTKLLDESRQETRRNMLGIVAKLTHAVLFENEQDMVLFIDNLERIKARRIGFFNRLPLFMLDNPFAFTLRAILWTVIENAHPVQLNIAADPLPEYSATMLHTFRFNWKNTRAANFWDDASRLKVMNFLLSLQSYEAELNQEFKTYIREHLVNMPSMRQHLEPFLQLPQLITFYVRFEAVNHEDLVRTKECVLVLAFHRDVLNSILATGNHYLQIDTRRNFFLEKSKSTVFPFCTCCLVNHQHWSESPVSFAGTVMRWGYTPEKKRTTLSRCALFPVHHVQTYNTCQAFLRFTPCLLSPDFDHFEAQDEDFGNHMCGNHHQMMTLWPAFVRVDDSHAINNAVSDILLQFFR